MMHQFQPVVALVRPKRDRIDFDACFGPPWSGLFGPVRVCFRSVSGLFRACLGPFAWGPLLGGLCLEPFAWNPLLGALCFGACLGLAWGLLGACLGLAWGLLWGLLGACLGACLGPARLLFGHIRPCLGPVWVLFGSALSRPDAYLRTEIPSSIVPYIVMLPVPAPEFEPEPLCAQALHSRTAATAAAAARRSFMKRVPQRQSSILAWRPVATPKRRRRTEAR
jgi:hypothetical protein